MLALIEYIHKKEEAADFDITEAITRLGDCDETVKRLENVNTELRQELEELKDKVNRQQKYLKEQGYKVNMSKTT